MTLSFETTSERSVVEIRDRIERRRYAIETSAPVSPTPADAVLASPETSLDTEAIYEGETYLEPAYGDAGDTTPQDRLTSRSATFDVTISGTTVANYSLPNVKPTTYDWSSLLDAETDTTDPVSWLSSGQVTVSA